VNTVVVNPGLVTPRAVNQGDIWLVSLDPTVGSEIQKTRPCLILSPREMNDYVRTVLIAPLTSGSRPVSFRVPVRHGGKEGLILLDQIRSVDRSRLVKCSGPVDSKTLTAVLSILRAVFEE
jgi:mRNA interferase MazF